MPKILYLVAEDWHFVTHRLPLAVAARDAGFEVVVVTRPGDKCATIQLAGIRTIAFAMNRGGMNPLLEIASIWRLLRILRQEKPDVLHVVALKPVVLGGLAARLVGIRHVAAAVTGLGFLFTDGGRSPLVTALIRRLFPWITRHGRVIVQNPEDAALIAGCGVPPEDIRLIRGAGVDLRQFAAMPEGDGVPLVMLPSRLLWDKGVGEFVAAARRLRSEGLAARFVLVGVPDPSNPTSVPEANITRWVAEGIVEWWGLREDMPEVLAQAHLVCLPSYREGLPKVLLEAMACGRAIVTTDVPGCRDAVLNGKTGLLVQVKEVDALARAIRHLVDHPVERRRLGTSGRARAVGEFSKEKVIEETLMVYRELLA